MRNRIQQSMWVVETFRNFNLFYVPKELESRDFLWLHIYSMQIIKIRYGTQWVPGPLWDQNDNFRPEINPIRMRKTT